MDLATAEAARPGAPGAPGRNTRTATEARAVTVDRAVTRMSRRSLWRCARRPITWLTVIIWEALNALNGIAESERGARWYYYSAVAHQGLGILVTAREHAARAVALEPSNLQYRQFQQHLEYGDNWYESRGEAYEQPYAGVTRWCLNLVLLNLFCNLCCCGPPLYLRGAAFETSVNSVGYRYVRYPNRNTAPEALAFGAVWFAELSKKQSAYFPEYFSSQYLHR